MMLNRLSPRRRLSAMEWLRRIDRAAADLNVLLLVLAIGLATLDGTLFVTKQIVEHLPPVTRVSYDNTPHPAPDAAPNPSR